jgi:hypothetical protein
VSGACDVVAQHRTCCQHKGLARAGASGGEVDNRNYYDDIASKQKTVYKPAFLPLDICLQRSALGVLAR